jgi:NAD(P)H-hydrate epimerase
VGEVVVQEIGIPDRLLEEVGAQLFLLQAGDAARAFPTPSPTTHKGDNGHLLVVAGSLGKTGAAVLAGRAGLLAGAGLVTVATPAPVLPVVAAGCAELMTEPLPVAGDGGLDGAAVDRALVLARQCSAVALGPGLGQSESTREFVVRFVAGCPAPLVIDADGLNLLAPIRDERSQAALSQRSASTLLTPHPGEMARLSGMTTREVLARRVEVARHVSHQARAVTLLKGYRTLVVDPDGRVGVNPTGNPGMATGGSGDVLTGLIGALVAAGRAPWLAAASGAYLHGLAGDRACARRGTHSLVAGDLLAEIPGAVREVLSG